MVFVGFSTPRRWNPLSALIRWMTRSRTSHAWILVEDPAFELRLVLEAHTTGLRLVPFARFVKGNKLVALVQASHPLERGLPRTGERLGEKYDVIGLVGIFVTLVLRWFRQRPWRNPFPTPRALFCSEAVVLTLKAAGYPRAAELGDETTTPAEVLEFLRTNPDNVVYERDDLKLWRHLEASAKADRRARRRRRAPLPQPDLDGANEAPALPPEAPPAL